MQAALARSVEISMISQELKWRTPGIRIAPKHHHSLWVLRENLVQGHSKPIQMSNMQWTEIMVESVVEKDIVNRKVDNWFLWPGACPGVWNTAYALVLRPFR